MSLALSAQNKSQSATQARPAKESPFRVKHRMLPGQDLLQRREGQCPCGGGCPRCQSELPIQTKLAVSQPGDIYEQEGDRVAEQVMRMPEPTVQRSCAPCAAGGSPCPKCEDESEELVQRKTEEVSDPSGVSVSDNFLQNLGPGQPLDQGTRAFFEPRFGHDFSQVRVHTGATAAESAQAVNALAYTVGRDVVFGEGQYAPGTGVGKGLLAHELTHVLQQTGLEPVKGPGLLLQRQEETTDHAKRVVVGNPRIDVRAQFALLRLLRGSAEDAATARAMIDEIEKDTLKGIFGDDLKKAADVASLRGTRRWELVPKGRDAVWIHDANPDSPAIIFKEAAGQGPRLDRALITVYRADPDPNDPFCLTSTELAPACLFTDKQTKILDDKLRQARDRVEEVSRLLKTPEGPDIAKAAAKNLFSIPVPNLDEIKQAVNGTLAILAGSTIRFACRTCGDLNCRLAVVAYVFKPGQMPILICASRQFSRVFIGQMRRTIIHEAVHLSGIDTDTSKTEVFCEDVAECAGQCHGKENAESWARYIDCLGEPLLVPPPIIPNEFPPPRPIPLPGLK